MLLKIRKIEEVLYGKKNYSDKEYFVTIGEEKEERIFFDNDGIKWFLTDVFSSREEGAFEVYNMELTREIDGATMKLSDFAPTKEYLERIKRFLCEKDQNNVTITEFEI